MLKLKLPLFGQAFALIKNRQALMCRAVGIHAMVHVKLHQKTRETIFCSKETVKSPSSCHFIDSSEIRTAYLQV